MEEEGFSSERYPPSPWEKNIPRSPSLGIIALECGMFVSKSMVHRHGMEQNVENHCVRTRQKLETQSSTLNGPIKEQTKKKQKIHHTVPTYQQTDLYDSLKYSGPTPEF